MTSEVKINYDAEELAEKLPEAIAADFQSWWYEKSKSDKHFYQRMSSTVEADGKDIVADGLAAYIADKRPYLVEEYFETGMDIEAILNSLDLL